ncbi:MAG TPA: YcgN family cysteine cluster protein, partial [Aquamicrobium sp.]|nr:YcgN family cysteine cluster protein [Aquamicrobium sp.]
GCRLFDGATCRCRDYPNRLASVPDCIRLTPQNVRTIPWLPQSCAYRLVAEGRDLYWWHHLVSGSRETVHEAGISVRGRVTASEDDLAEPEDYFDHMLEEEP